MIQNIKTKKTVDIEKEYIDVGDSDHQAIVEIPNEVEVTNLSFIL
jgi:hypothetical protein